MTNEVSIRCQKTSEVGIRRIPAYTPQYTPEVDTPCGTCGIRHCDDKIARNWIQCQQCNIWYHNECQGLTERGPKNFTCIDCENDWYFNLLHFWWCPTATFNSLLVFLISITFRLTDVRIFDLCCQLYFVYLIIRLYKKVKRLDKSIHGLLRFLNQKTSDRLLKIHRDKWTKHVRGIRRRHDVGVNLPAEKSSCLEADKVSEWVVA